MASIINATTSSGVAVSGDTSGVLQLATNGGTTAVTIDTSQNVGIGNTTPSSYNNNAYKLVIGSNSAVAGMTFATGTSAAANIFFARGTSGTDAYDGYLQYAQIGQYMSFGTGGGTERMRITSDGNVGIGTTIPNLSGAGKALTVNSSTGAIYELATAGSRTAYFYNDGTSTQLYTTTASGSFLFGTNNTERMRIDASGNLLVGRTDNPNSLTAPALYVTGVYTNTTGSAANVFVNSNGALVRSTSSLKYKTDVQDATHGLEDLLKLRPVTYKGKSEQDGDTVFGGLIAEEVDAAGLTEFVQYAENGTPDALAYGNMVSLCIKAIQEQQALITTLQTQVAELKQKVGA